MVKKSNFVNKFIKQAILAIFIFIYFQLIEGLLELQIVQHKAITFSFAFLFINVVIVSFCLKYFSAKKDHESDWFLHALNLTTLCVLCTWLVMHIITPFVHASSNQQALSQLFQNAIKHPSYLFAYLFITCVAAPLSEEILFRSWLLNIALTTKRQWLSYMMIAISVICFILPHMSGGSWCLVFLYLPITFLLTWHYIKHQRLYENVIIHGLYNLLTLILI